MKIALTSEIVAPIKNIHEEIKEDDTAKEIAEKVVKPISGQKSLQKMREVISLKKCKIGWYLFHPIFLFQLFFNRTLS